MEAPEIAALKAGITALETEIAERTAALRALKYRYRAVVAARASAEARAHSPKALALREKYLAAEGGYGTIRRLADEVGMTEQHAHRVLKDLKIGRAATSGAAEVIPPAPDAMVSPMAAPRAQTAPDPMDDGARGVPKRRPGARRAGKKTPPPDPRQDALFLTVQDDPTHTTDLPGGSWGAWRSRWASGSAER